MATSAQQDVYQCDQCGTPEIVAVPILYQQGTRTFSGLFNHGVSQSFWAQVVAPPKPRSYAGRLLTWGFPVALFTIATYFDLRAFLQRSTISAQETEIAIVFLFLCLASIWGMGRSVLKVSRYNREVYPKRQSDWAHTFMCRRCGKLFMIP
jgi:hypothetical protein